MSIVEFYRIGDHGAAEVPPVKYPWSRWMDGQRWGFEPEFFQSTQSSFRKRLNETARVAGMTVDLEDHTIDHVTWVVFTYSKKNKG